MTNLTMLSSISTWLQPSNVFLMYSNGATECTVSMITIS